jgi:hypothetical protein
MTEGNAIRAGKSGAWPERVPVFGIRPTGSRAWRNTQRPGGRRRFIGRELGSSLVRGTGRILAAAAGRRREDERVRC